MFGGPELRVICEVVSNQVIEEATHLTDDAVLAATDDELLDDFMSRCDMEAPVLDWEQKYVTEGGSGSSIQLHVPFTGTKGLFENQPNFYTANWPEGDVRRARL